MTKTFKDSAEKNEVSVFVKFYVYLLTAIYILFGGFLLIALIFGVIGHSTEEMLHLWKPILGLISLLAYSIFYLEIEKRVVRKNIYSSFRFVSITALSSFLFSLFFFIMFYAMEKNGCIGGWGALGYIVITALLSGTTGFLLIFRILLWFFVKNSEMTDMYKKIPSNKN